jgi:hypothetical protein
VVRDPSQTETVELALKLHPRTTRIHVVAYAPLVEGYEQRIASALGPVARGVTLTYANEADAGRRARDDQRLPADSLIFYTRYTRSPWVGSCWADEVIARDHRGVAGAGLQQQR